MSDFELLKVTSVSSLHENLEKLLSNKAYVDAITIDTMASEIRVDLSRTANMFGNSDFRIKVQASKLSEAKQLIERMKSQQQPSRSQSEALFHMLVTN